jgi:hypothetical protein
MRFRTQALAALAAVSAIATAFGTAKASNTALVFWFFVVICGIWLAAAILDLFYYSRLRDAASETIRSFEAEHPKPGSGKGPEGLAIQFSHRVNGRLGRAHRAVWLFYAIVLVFLIAVTIRTYFVSGSAGPPASIGTPVTITHRFTERRSQRWSPPARRLCVKSLPVLVGAVTNAVLGGRLVRNGLIVRHRYELGRAGLGETWAEVESKKPPPDPTASFLGEDWWRLPATFAGLFVGLWTVLEWAHVTDVISAALK